MHCRKSHNHPPHPHVLQGLGKLVSDGLHGHNRHQHDSAHHTDDSEDNDGLLDSAGRGGSMAPFHIAAGAHGGKDGASYV